jgi:hypothetical protein
MRDYGIMTQSLFSTSTDLLDVMKVSSRLVSHIYTDRDRGAASKNSNGHP